jgi:hypothetical protein
MVHGGDMVDQNSRERPYPYLKRAIDMLSKRSAPIIVEIGACRTIPNHDIDDFSKPCCNDGHSTMIFVRTGYTVYSIDISKPQIDTLSAYFKKDNPTNLHLTCEDGIKFLEQFHEQIDLLYLDAWDVGLESCQENHTLAYITAKKNLGTKSIIVVDDTDINFKNGEYFLTIEEIGGKGTTLAPLLKKEGWKILYQGRQTAWTR